MKMAGPNTLVLSRSDELEAQQFGQRNTKSSMSTQKQRRQQFERLLIEQADDLFRMAVRLTSDVNAAEEIVQEALVRAIGAWESFQAKSQFKTWVCQILINTFRDQIRKNSRRGATEPLPPELTSSFPSAESRAVATELKTLVTQLIADLPEREREVLVLATYESMSAQQIGEIVGIKVENVHATLSNARKKLKQKLARHL